MKPKLDKFIIWWLLILTVLAICFSCTKNYEPVTLVTYDKYSIAIDWYTEGDSVWIKREYSWKDDSVYYRPYKTLLETKVDEWNLMCLPYRHIEHLYYLKNGVKIWKTVYPK